ncbi:uncharacterized protein [Antedon mediterranea]|uniref:uncharacterized protein isoform X2 n=1 Tax=Antedon mediterranea TaxID=105859 RepID=UPI003AF714BC
MANVFDRLVSKHLKCDLSKDSQNIESGENFERGSAHDLIAGDVDGKTCCNRKTGDRPIATSLIDRPRTKLLLPRSINCDETPRSCCESTEIENANVQNLNMETNQIRTNASEPESDSTFSRKSPSFDATGSGSDVEVVSVKKRTLTTKLLENVKKRQPYAPLKKPFVIPRKHKNDKELLQEVKLDSREYLKEIHPILMQNYRDQMSKNRFAYVTAYIVNNQQLLTEFLDKKREMKEEGRNDKELKDSYGFYYCPILSTAKEIAARGLRIKTSLIKCLGNPSMGVYVSRHSDIVRPALFVPNSQEHFLVIFRIIKGKVKSIQESYSNTVTLEPTPNYDCHISKNAKQKTNYDVNQIYLYEYGDEDMVARPRHAYPYAVVKFNFKEVKKDLPKTVIVPSTVTNPLPSTSSSSDNAVAKTQSTVNVKKPVIEEKTLTKKSGMIDSYTIWKGKLTNKKNPLFTVELISKGVPIIPFKLPNYLDLTMKVPIERLKTQLPERLFNASAENLLEVQLNGRYYLNCICKSSFGDKTKIQNLVSYLQKHRIVSVVKLPGTYELFFYSSEKASDALYCLFSSKTKMMSNLKDVSDDKADGSLPCRKEIPFAQERLVKIFTEQCKHIEEMQAKTELLKQLVKQLKKPANNQNQSEATQSTKDPRLLKNNPTALSLSTSDAPINRVHPIPSENVSEISPQLSPVESWPSLSPKPQMKSPPIIPPVLDTSDYGTFGSGWAPPEEEQEQNVDVSNDTEMIKSQGRKLRQLQEQLFALHRAREELENTTQLKANKQKSPHSLQNGKPVFHSSTPSIHIAHQMKKEEMMSSRDYITTPTHPQQDEFLSPASPEPTIENIGFLAINASNTFALDKVKLPDNVFTKLKEITDITEKAKSMDVTVNALHCRPAGSHSQTYRLDPSQLNGPYGTCGIDIGSRDNSISTVVNNSDVSYGDSFCTTYERFTFPPPNKASSGQHYSTDTFDDYTSVGMDYEFLSDSEVSETLNDCSQKPSKSQSARQSFACQTKSDVTCFSLDKDTLSTVPVNTTEMPNHNFGPEYMQLTPASVPDLNITEHSICLPNLVVSYPLTKLNEGKDKRTVIPEIENEKKQIHISTSGQEPLNKRCKFQHVRNNVKGKSKCKNNPSACKSKDNKPHISKNTIKGKRRRHLPENDLKKLSKQIYSKETLQVKSFCKSKENKVKNVKMMSEDDSEKSSFEVCQTISAASDMKAYLNTALKHSSHKLSEVDKMKEFLNSYTIKSKQKSKHGKLKTKNSNRGKHKCLLNAGVGLSKSKRRNNSKKAEADSKYLCFDANSKSANNSNITKVEIEENKETQISKTIAIKNEDISNTIEDSQYLEKHVERSKVNESVTEKELLKSTIPQKIQHENEQITNSEDQTADSKFEGITSNISWQVSDGQKKDTETNCTDQSVFKYKELQNNIDETYNSKHTHEIDKQSIELPSMCNSFENTVTHSAEEVQTEQSSKDASRSLKTGNFRQSSIVHSILVAKEQEPEVERPSTCKNENGFCVDLLKQSSDAPSQDLSEEQSKQLFEIKNQRSRNEKTTLCSDLKSSSVHIQHLSDEQNKLLSKEESQKSFKEGSISSLDPIRQASEVNTTHLSEPIKPWSCVNSYQSCNEENRLCSDQIRQLSEGHHLYEKQNKMMFEVDVQPSSKNEKQSTKELVRQSYELPIKHEHSSEESHMKWSDESSGKMFQTLHCQSSETHIHSVTTHKTDLLSKRKLIAPSYFSEKKDKKLKRDTLTDRDFDSSEENILHFYNNVHRIKKPQNRSINEDSSSNDVEGQKSFIKTLCQSRPNMIVKRKGRNDLTIQVICGINRTDWWANATSKEDELVKCVLHSLHMNRNVSIDGDDMSQSLIDGILSTVHRKKMKSKNKVVEICSTETTSDTVSVSDIEDKLLFEEVEKIGCKKTFESGSFREKCKKLYELYNYDVPAVPFTKASAVEFKPNISNDIQDEIMSHRQGDLKSFVKTFHEVDSKTLSDHENVDLKDGPERKGCTVKDEDNVATKKLPKIKPIKLNLTKSSSIFISKEKAIPQKPMVHDITCNKNVVAEGAPIPVIGAAACKSLKTNVKQIESRISNRPMLVRSKEVNNVHCNLKLVSDIQTTQTPSLHPSKQEKLDSYSDTKQESRSETRNVVDVTLKEPASILKSGKQLDSLESVQSKEVNNVKCNLNLVADVPNCSIHPPEQEEIDGWSNKPQSRSKPQQMIGIFPKDPTSLNLGSCHQMDDQCKLSISLNGDQTIASPARSVQKVTSVILGLDSSLGVQGRINTSNIQDTSNNGEAEKNTKACVSDLKTEHSQWEQSENGKLSRTQLKSANLIDKNLVKTEQCQVEVTIFNKSSHVAENGNTETIDGFIAVQEDQKCDRIIQILGRRKTECIDLITNPSPQCNFIKKRVGKEIDMKKEIKTEPSLPADSNKTVCKGTENNNTEMIFQEDQKRTMHGRCKTDCKEIIKKEIKRDKEQVLDVKNVYIKNETCLPNDSNDGACKSYCENEDKYNAKKQNEQGKKKLLDGKKETGSSSEGGDQKCRWRHIEDIQVKVTNMHTKAETRKVNMEDSAMVREMKNEIKLMNNIESKDQNKHVTKRRNDIEESGKVDDAGKKLHNRKQEASNESDHRRRHIEDIHVKLTNMHSKAETRKVNIDVRTMVREIKKETDVMSNIESKDKNKLVTKRRHDIEESGKVDDAGEKLHNRKQEASNESDHRRRHIEDIQIKITKGPNDIPIRKVEVSEKARKKTQDVLRSVIVKKENNFKTRNFRRYDEITKKDDMTSTKHHPRNDKNRYEIKKQKVSNLRSDKAYRFKEKSKPIVDSMKEKSNYKEGHDTKDRRSEHKIRATRINYDRQNKYRHHNSAQVRHTIDRSRHSKSVQDKYKTWKFSRLRSIYKRHNIQKSHIRAGNRLRFAENGNQQLMQHNMHSNHQSVGKDPRSQQCMPMHGNQQQMGGDPRNQPCVPMHGKQQQIGGDPRNQPCVPIHGNQQRMGGNPRSQQCLPMHGNQQQMGGDPRNQPCVPTHGNQQHIGEDPRNQPRVPMHGNQQQRGADLRSQQCMPMNGNQQQMGADPRNQPCVPTHGNQQHIGEDPRNQPCVPMHGNQQPMGGDSRNQPCAPMHVNQQNSGEDPRNQPCLPMHTNQQQRGADPRRQQCMPMHVNQQQMGGDSRNQPCAPMHVNQQQMGGDPRNQPCVPVHGNQQQMGGDPRNQPCVPMHVNQQQIGGDPRNQPCAPMHVNQQQMGGDPRNQPCVPMHGNQQQMGGDLRNQPCAPMHGNQQHIGVDPRNQPCVTMHGNQQQMGGDPRNPQCMQMHGNQQQMGGDSRNQPCAPMHVNQQQMGGDPRNQPCVPMHGNQQQMGGDPRNQPFVPMHGNQQQMGGDPRNQQFMPMHGNQQQMGGDLRNQPCVAMHYNQQHMAGDPRSHQCIPMHGNQQKMGGDPRNQQCMSIPINQHTFTGDPRSQQNMSIHGNQQIERGIRNFHIMDQPVSSQQCIPVMNEFISVNRDQLETGILRTQQKIEILLKQELTAIINNNQQRMLINNNPEMSMIDNHQQFEVPANQCGGMMNNTPNGSNIPQQIHPHTELHNNQHIMCNKRNVEKHVLYQNGRIVIENVELRQQNVELILNNDNHQISEMHNQTNIRCNEPNTKQENNNELDIPNNHLNTPWYGNQHNLEIPQNISNCQPNQQNLYFDQDMHDNNQQSQNLATYGPSTWRHAY